MAANPLTQLVKTSSGLKEVTGEDLATRANSLGLSTTPTNPLSAAAIGANPDQAKMAGTAANKGAALRESVSQDQELSTFQRTKQDKLNSDDPKQARLNELTQAALGFSGSLNDRTEAMKAKAFQTATTKLKPALNVDKWKASKPAGTSDAQWDAATQALTRFAEGTAQAQDFIEVSKALGKAAVKAEDLTPFLAGGETQIAEAIASAAPDKLSTKDMLNESEIQTISELLNLTKEEIAAFSVQDLQKNMDKVIDSEYRDAEILLASAFDPNASPAERATAKNLLRESGTTGQRMLEDRMAQVGEDVEEATTITVAGEEVSLEDAFKNEAIQGMVKRYFDEPKFKEKLRTTEPELFAAIQAQEAEFKQFSDTLPDQLKEYSLTQEANQKANLVQGGRAIPEETMKLLVPEWGTPQATEYKVPKIFETLKNPAFAEQVPYIENVITELTQGFPEVVKTLSNYSYDQLALAGLTTAKGVEDFKRNVVTYKAIENVDPKASPAAYFQTVFGMNQEDVAKALNKALNMKAMGNKDKNIQEFLDLVDYNRDGKLDDLSRINQDVKSYLGQNYRNNPLAIGSTGSKNPMSLMEKISAVSSTDPLYNKVSGKLKNGKLETADLLEITGPTGSEVSYAELDQLAKSFPGKVSSEVNKIKSSKTLEEANREVFSLVPEADVRDWVQGAAAGNLNLGDDGVGDAGTALDRIGKVDRAMDVLRKQINANPNLTGLLNKTLDNLAAKRRAYDATYTAMKNKAAADKKKKDAAIELARKKALAAKQKAEGGGGANSGGGQKGTGMGAMG